MTREAKGSKKRLSRDDVVYGRPHTAYGSWPNHLLHVEKLAGPNSRICRICISQRDTIERKPFACKIFMASTEKKSNFLSTVSYLETILDSLFLR